MALAEEDPVVLASQFPPTTVLPPTTTTVESLPPNTPPNMPDWELCEVKGSAEPAEQVVAPPMTMLLLESPLQQIRSLSSSLEPVMLPSQQ